MEARIRAFDWTKTSVGARESWPPALHHAVSIALNSAFPAAIYWGSDLIQIYNDRFATLLGARHPAALGTPVGDTWFEIRDYIEEKMREVVTTGVPFYVEDQLLVVQRFGYAEDAYFTFCYSPIETPHGPGGILNLALETTASTNRESEFRLMADTVANIVFTQRPDGSVAWANLRWHTFTGLAPDSAAPADVWRLIVAPGDYGAYLDAFARGVEIGAPYELEVRLRPIGGDEASYRWHLVRGVPMPSRKSGDALIAGSATDVHDRHVAAQLLHERLVSQQQASLAFQHAALLKAFPDVPWLDFDAIYVPAGGEHLVGGDWYDAFRLLDGRVVISVGDVIGSGLDAAVTMASVRQAIRGAAQVLADPAAVLDAADRALRSEQPGRIVTAIVGVLEPLTHEFVYASAGHPAPLLRYASGAIEELGARGLPLGLRNHGYSGNARAIVPEHALLVVHTDGLTEATHDVFEGERRLYAALASEAVYTSANPAEAIYNAVLGSARDDVAVMTVRVAQVSEFAIPHWTFASSDGLEAQRVRRSISELLASAGAAPGEVADAELVFSELVGNVARHAGSRVEVAIDLSVDEPVLHVLDNGPGFVPNPRLPVDAYADAGRGLSVVDALTRNVQFMPRSEGGTHVLAVFCVKNFVPHAVARA